VDQGLLVIEASLSHSVIHTTLGRTLLDEWSARLRHLYLTTHNNHRWQPPFPRRNSNPHSQQASGRSTVGLCTSLSYEDNGFSVKKFLHFLQSDGSLQFSQQTATLLHPAPDCTPSTPSRLLYFTALVTPGHTDTHI
jgi:hypothetical protein